VEKGLNIKAANVLFLHIHVGCPYQDNIILPEDSEKIPVGFL
jgi:hypothetical protein